VLDGTVQSVDDRAVWVLMDDWFDPGHMSGSPFVSQHTGQVVGMAVAASPGNASHRLAGPACRDGDRVAKTLRAEQRDRLTPARPIESQAEHHQFPVQPHALTPFFDRTHPVNWRHKVDSQGSLCYAWACIPHPQRGKLCGKHTRCRLP
jgi:hypothetical protein